ncbi:hypothetical protein RHS01_07772 [Rhizoctonia solani]|uniref:Uncharacterized protein n=1 Tax=Rhizoctonia solani TaxID=456999 RepID=A0A8H7I9Z2_9AGAM|nr:hypothetical protein RHS01_07772 [Rhizoctonia solani]
MASTSYDDHITGGPGAPGMADIDSPIIPTEIASGLTFNADGSINFGLMDEAGAYNAGFGSDAGLAAASGAGTGPGPGPGTGARPFGQTFPTSIRSPSFMFGAGSRVDPVNDHTRTRPPRRGRGRAGNWKSETILRVVCAGMCCLRGNGYCSGQALEPLRWGM